MLGMRFELIPRYREGILRRFRPRIDAVKSTLKGPSGAINGSLGAARNGKSVTTSVTTGYDRLTLRQYALIGGRLG